MHNGRYVIITILILLIIISSALRATAVNYYTHILHQRGIPISQDNVKYESAEGIIKIEAKIVGIGATIEVKLMIPQVLPRNSTFPIIAEFVALKLSKPSALFAGVKKVIISNIEIHALMESKEIDKVIAYIDSVVISREKENITKIIFTSLPREISNSVSTNDYVTITLKFTSNNIELVLTNNHIFKSNELAVYGSYPILHARIGAVNRSYYVTVFRTKTVTYTKVLTKLLTTTITVYEISTTSIPFTITKTMYKTLTKTFTLKQLITSVKSITTTLTPSTITSTVTYVLLRSANEFITSPIGSLIVSLLVLIASASFLMITTRRRGR